MRCEYCGAENSDDVEFCVFCGYPLGDEQNQIDNFPVFGDEKPQYETSMRNKKEGIRIRRMRKKKKLAKIGAIAFAVIVMIIFCNLETLRSLDRFFTPVKYDGVKEYTTKTSDNSEVRGNIIETVESKEELIENTIESSENIDVMSMADNVESDTLSSHWVEREKISVGENVTASFNDFSGVVTLYSSNGTLHRDWISEAHIKSRKIRRIRVEDGVVHLPSDSSAMFMNCTNMKKFDFSSFDTSNVTSVKRMFSYCSTLEELSFTGFDSSNVTDMSYMLYGCSALKEVDLSGFDTSNLNDMSNLFNGCSSMAYIKLGSFDTSNVMRMTHLFFRCKALVNLDLSSFDMSNVEYAEAVFYKCDKLKQLRTPKGNRQTIELPITMYDEFGKVYHELPVASESIVLQSE